jgi:8-hydroxy-5-deazaflavin:NADPH oxidoreductase
MDVTIIGTGNMARGIATRAVAGGHNVTLIGTDPDKAKQLADEVGAKAGEGTIEGDVVVPAVWYGSVDRVLQQYGDQLDGKVVVDITNAVDPDTFEPLDIAAGSIAQEIAAKVPGAKVVKAFNTTFAGTLAEGEVAGNPLDVFIASDDEDAKQKVSELAESSGLRPVDAGPLRRARELEALGYLHMTLQDGLGTGYGSTVKVLG